MQQELLSHHVILWDLHDQIGNGLLTLTVLVFLQKWATPKHKKWDNNAYSLSGNWVTK